MTMSSSTPKYLEICLKCANFLDSRSGSALIQYMAPTKLLIQIGYHAKI